MTEKKEKTCLYSIAYERFPGMKGNIEYTTCGKPANFIDGNGRPVCGIHRRCADRVYQLQNKPLCQPYPKLKTEAKKSESLKLGDVTAVKHG